MHIKLNKNDKILTKLTAFSSKYKDDKTGLKKKKHWLTVGLI